MYRSGYELKTDVDFDNAILFPKKVEVLQQGEAIHQGGIIQNYSEHSVRIEEGFFLKSNCNFIIR